MKNKVFWKFAFKNIKANKILQVPFILSTGLMLSLFYIMSSLLFNDFVKTRHKDLPMFIRIGVVVVAIFTIIFVIYANSFLTKRRNKEFALYGVLGLEKKHISKILRIEQFINFTFISILGIVGGFLIGKLLFLVLNIIMNEKQAGLMDYPFEAKAAIGSIGLLIAALTFTHILNTLKVRLSDPIQLLGSQRSAQKEPKSKWTLMFLGLTSLLGGYYIALTTKGLMDAILLFFVAIILVMIGTYLLFTSLTIIVLKWMKSKKNYYYQSNNFLSISGMLYRMKGNGVGLASICILCTGIIITLGTTLTIYKGIDNIVETTMKTQYEITDLKSYNPNNSREEINKSKINLANIIQRTQIDDINVKDLNISENIFVPVVNDKNKLLVATRDNIGEGLTTYYMMATTLEDYNLGRNKKLSLNEDEIFMSSNMKKLRDTKSLVLADTKYKVKQFDDKVPGNIAIGAYTIVVPNRGVLVQLSNYYKLVDLETNTLLPADIKLSSRWNVTNNNIGYENYVRTTIEGSDYILNTKKDVEKDIYTLNGGFLFLGIIIGAIFIIGTVLITYYKQVSEGYEDRANYQIMKKVGLSDELISKTAKKQIVWMFFLPLIVASIHTMVASKILYNLLSIFGIYTIFPFATSLIEVIGIFAIAYLIVFVITSRIYYKIVN